MPTATDLVTDLPADFEVFGQAVATSMADLLGGSLGYILSKNSATDMDFSWIENDAITAFKPLPYINNNYYGSPATSIRSTTQVFAAGTTYYTPIFIRQNQTFDRIALVTGSTFSGAASIRLGIYNSTAGVPSTVALDAGLVAPVAASTSYEVTISQALTPGWYWLASNSVTAATTNTINAISAAAFPNSADNGASSSSGNPLVTYTQTVSAAASFATAASLTAAASAAPAITLRT